MNQIEPALSPAEAAALQQLLGALSASEDRVAAASRKVTDGVQAMAAQMESHVGQLMASQERLQKTFIETTSQIKQLEQVSVAQSQAVSGMMGLEQSLYEETCEKIKAANEAIKKHAHFETFHESFYGARNRAQRGFRDFSDVEMLLCAYHGPVLVFHLKKFALAYEQEVEAKNIHWLQTGELFLAYHRIKVAWLKEHFYPERRNAPIPALWLSKPVVEPILERMDREEKKFVHVPPLCSARVSPVHVFPPKDVALPVIEYQAVELVERFEKFRQEEILPKPREPFYMDDLFEPRPVYSHLGTDPLLQSLQVASSQLMAGVEKTKFTAEMTLLDMKSRINRLVSRNRRLLSMTRQAVVELDIAKTEVLLNEKQSRKRIADFPAQMKLAQAAWVNTVMQTFEKVEAARKENPDVQFSELLTAFFSGKLENAIAALDRLSVAIEKDPHFTEAGRKVAVDANNQRKETWSKRLQS